MSIKKNIIITAALLCLSGSVFAATAPKTTVDIVIDSAFKQQNIVFSVSDLGRGIDEGVGVYKANGPLFIAQKVDSIIDDGFPLPEVVTAYVTDTKLGATRTYVTNLQYSFDGETVELSFPGMFHQQS